MRMRLFGLLLASAVFPSSATAARVVVISPGGHAVVANDPYLTGPAITPAPSATATIASGGGVAPGATAPSHSTSKRGKHRKKRKPPPTVASELLRLYHSGAIPSATYHGYLAQWNSALATERRLHGTRKAELTAVTETLHNIAAAKLFAPTRLAQLFLTLERNAQYWSAGPLLGYGQRVEFTGSQLVWEYYPGQGIQLQVLGTFGKADGLYTAGPSQYPALRALLGEMIPLAVVRGGSLTWEYDFTFDGGQPPWTSAMSQGTAIEAFTRGALSMAGVAYPVGVPNYLSIAHQLLRLLTIAPPTGVGVKTTAGMRYVQYSFAGARSEEVINAFLQTLIGLHDYAQASQDPTAAFLFTQGSAEAQAELPGFDTGAWSLYQPGLEDTIDYHNLVTGFLGILCTDTAAPLYCATQQHFQAYLHTPPVLTLRTSSLRVRKSTSISFSLSKASHVGIAVLNGSQTVLATSANFPYGVHAFSITAPRHKGQWTVRMSATDLAGNFAQTSGTISVGS